MDSIYKENVLWHWRYPKNYGRIKKPNRSSLLSNPSCGDEIRMDIRLGKNKIADIKFSGHGCVISRASASMLTEYARGKNVGTLKKIDRDFIMKMLGVKLNSNRLRCALLPLETLKKIISNNP